MAIRHQKKSNSIEKEIKQTEKDDNKGPQKIDILEERQARPRNKTNPSWRVSTKSTFLIIMSPLATEENY